MLKEMRGHHGGPSVAVKLLAVVMALLLAFPLTYFLFTLGSRALGTLF